MAFNFAGSVAAPELTLQALQITVTPAIQAASHRKLDCYHLQPAWLLRAGFCQANTYLPSPRETPLDQGL
jgi:hypothetical protein